LKAVVFCRRETKSDLIHPCEVDRDEIQRHLKRKLPIHALDEEGTFTQQLRVLESREVISSDF
jgi:hypothetical protein